MQLITAKQAAEILGVRLPRLYELVRQDALPCVRLGLKQLRFDPKSLEEWSRQGGGMQLDRKVAEASRHEKG